MLYDSLNCIVVFLYHLILIILYEYNNDEIYWLNFLFLFFVVNYDGIIIIKFMVHTYTKNRPYSNNHHNYK